jgi:hypothetical protein
MRGPVAYVIVEQFVHSGRRNRLVTKGSPRLRLNERQKIAEANIGVQVVALLLGKGAGAGSFRKLVDPRLIGFGKIEGQKEPCCIGRDVGDVWPNHPFEDRDFIAGSHTPDCTTVPLEFRLRVRPGSTEHGRPHLGLRQWSNLFDGGGTIWSPLSIDG